MRRVVAIVLAGSLLALTAGCQSMPRLPQISVPRISAPEFPDFARMFADLFGTPLDAPIPQPPPLAQPAVADRVVVLKSQRRLELVRNGKPFAAFAIALGSNPVGPKER